MLYILKVQLSSFLPGIKRGWESLLYLVIMSVAEYLPIRIDVVPAWLASLNTTEIA